MLDTQAWLWAMETPGALPRRVRAHLFDAGYLPFALSAISPWEIAKKASAGRLTLSTPLRHWLSQATRQPFVELLPLTIDVAYEANHLPGSFHRDPADQIIVATARLCGLTLITSDKQIQTYGNVKTLWE